MSIMIRCTLLHKRIYLIQEEHGFEVFSNLEYRLKLLLQRIGISVVDNKLACRNLGTSARQRSAPRLARTE